jgi:outer membrane protein TolC
MEVQEQSVREQVVLLVASQYLGGLRAQSRMDLAQALYEQARRSHMQRVSR